MNPSLLVRLIYAYYIILAEVPGVARGIKIHLQIYFRILEENKFYFLPVLPPPPGNRWVPSTNFSQFGPAVWPAIIANI